MTKLNKSNKLDNFPQYLLAFIIVTTIISAIQLYNHQLVKQVTISSHLEKINNGSTEYIVNIDMPDGKINPIIIENVWWLFRFDRTTTYAQLIEMDKTSPGKKYCVELYGIRIPSLSYQGLTSIRPIENCN